jgi:signal transduction histidine kinase
LISLGQPFYRVDGSQGQRAGLGLGLSIVKDCVAACRGTVLFRNRETGGFEVEIVLQSVTRRQSAPALPPVQGLPVRRTGRHSL